MFSEVQVVGAEELVIFDVRYWRAFTFSVATGSWIARGDSRFVVNSEGMMRFTDAAMAASSQIFSFSNAGTPTALQR